MLRNRQVCLLVDSEEPLRERFVRVAQQRGLSARTRKLPVGDFLWVLLPPGVNPDTVRDMPEQELVCKTWWLFTTYKNFLENLVPAKKFWGAMEHPKRKSCLSGRNIPNRNLFHSFKAVFDASFRPNGNHNSEIKFTSPEFVYHLLKRWTDWFAHVNGKQPMF